MSTTNNESSVSVSNSSLFWAVRAVQLSEFYSSICQFVSQLGRLKLNLALDALKAPPNKQSSLWAECAKPFYLLHAQEKKYLALEVFDGPQPSAGSFFGKGASQPEGYDKVLAEFRKLEDVFNEVIKELAVIVRREEKKKVSNLFESKEQRATIEFQVQQLRELCNQLGFFVELRITFVSVYKKIKGFLIPPEYHVLAEMFSESEKQIKDVMVHPALSYLCFNFSSEIRVLMFLFKSEANLENFSFKDTILCLSLCRQNLNSWLLSFNSSLEKKQSKKALSMTSKDLTKLAENVANNSFTDLHSESAYPSIINWCSEYLSSLIQKASLYFHGIFEQQMQNFSESISISKLQSFDYAYYIEEHVMRLGATHFALILNCNEIVNAILDQEGNLLGYKPNYQAEKPIGVKSFPIIFKYPRKSTLNEELPNVISLIFWKKDLLSQFRQVPFVLVESRPRDDEAKELIEKEKEKLSKRMYIIAQLNAHLYMTLIYENAPKDQTEAVEFIAKLSRQLRGLAIFDNLS